MMRKGLSLLQKRSIFSTVLNRVSHRSASTASLPETEPVVYHDELITTENIVRKLEELLQDDDSKSFKPRYEMTFEEFELQFKEQMNRTIYHDEDFVSFISKTLDFPKEEVEEVIRGQEPKFYKKSDNGDLDVDWIEFARLFQRTETEKSLLPQFEREFKEMKQFKLELEEESQKKQLTIDWAEWEKKLGSSTVLKLKSDFDKVVEKTRPRIDAKVLEEKLDELLKPVLGQLKDDLVEALPNIRQVTEDLVRETPLLKKEDNGLYQQYMAPWFIDKYFPQERDELIMEIEEDEWDLEYTAQIKATRLNPDEILTRNKDWITRESSKIEEDEYRSISSKAATLSAKKREEQNLYHGVIDGARRVKELESEVASLKSSSESGDDVKKDGEKKERKEDKLALSDDEWWSFLSSFGVSKDLKQKRDFAHFKSEQQLKSWEEGGEKDRIGAETEFFKTERLK